MLFPKLQNVSLSRLRPAAYNPSHRVFVSSPKMKKLMHSLENLGQINPIIVTPEYDIIDGHRRYYGLKKLGENTALVRIVEGDKKKIYASVNATQLRHSGNDNLGIWLKDSEALHPILSGRLDGIEAVVGRDIMLKVYNAGYSAALISTAQGICRVCDQETDENVVMMVKWLIKHKMAALVRAAMASGYDPHRVLSAAKRGVPIKLKLTA